MQYACPKYFPIYIFSIFSLKNDPKFKVHNFSGGLDVMVMKDLCPPRKTNS